MVPREYSQTSIGKPPARVGVPSVQDRDTPSQNKRTPGQHRGTPLDQDRSIPILAGEKIPPPPPQATGVVYGEGSMSLVFMQEEFSCSTDLSNAQVKFC